MNALALPGTVTRTGWNVPKNLTRGQWLEEMRKIDEVERGIQWLFGDAWRAGEARKEYGTGEQLAREIGIPYQTCRDAAWVAGRVELSRRRDNVPWSYYREIARFEPGIQDAFLDRVESEG